MNPYLHNDQQKIAQDFIFTDVYNFEVAQLAYQKIKSWKLAKIHSAFCKNQRELYEMVKKSLLTFVPPEYILCEEGFFLSETEN